MTRLEVLALDVDGVLTDGRVALTPNGEETKAIAFRDLDALTLARGLGLRIALITGEDGPLVDIIAKKTGAEHVLRGAKDKLAAIGVLAAHMNVSPKSICFVGDADRDAKAFASVGLALAPADASSRARREAHHVLKSRGGSGAVAEAVELIVSMSRASHAPPAPTQVFAGIIAESIAAHHAMLTESIPALSEISEVLIDCIAGGNKILFCGNGGSAADSQHVAAELVGRFARERDPWPAISLTCDTSILTAVGNDWEFEQVFSRQVRALARPGDVVVGISTSGKSPNVVRALEAARAKGAITIGFTGSAGGPIADAADHVFRAPSHATPRVQELHILAWHSICEVVEARLAPDSRLV
jgi:D-sedoheptulose 7-phosphate isomerase